MGSRTATGRGRQDRTAPVGTGQQQDFRLHPSVLHGKLYVPRGGLYPKEAIGVLLVSHLRAHLHDCHYVGESVSYSSI